MTISAVLTPCSARKRKLSSAPLDLVDLMSGPQDRVARQWLDQVGAAAGQVAAQDLYQGASFTRIRDVARAHASPLFVVSAGLGLVAGATQIPAYELTLSPSAPTRIQSRVTGRFEPADWWQHIQSGRFAAPMQALGAGDGRILIALTRPYAQLIGAALADSPAAVIARLRVFGSGLAPALPAALHAQLMPYDARLDALMPGTRLDFSSRALAHFAALIVDQPVGDLAQDAQRVRAALAPAVAPTNAMRPKASDEELVAHIGKLKREGLSKTSALRQLREGLGIACEQGRFRRLYNSVSA